MSIVHTDDLVQCLNEDLGNILKWSNCNKRSLNMSKTQDMCIHYKPFNTNLLPQLDINGLTIT